MPCSLVVSKTSASNLIIFNVYMPNQIEHELKDMWLARMDHLEHRMYIERSKGYNLWIGKSSSCRLTCPNDIIQLATKKFMTRQAVYRTELKELKRWEGEGLSGHGKLIFDALDDLVCDIALKIFNQHGYDTKTLLQYIWGEVFDVWLKESEWSRSREAPSIDEYLRVGTISVAVQAMFLPACYLANPKRLQNSPGTSYSKITKLLMLSARLPNDIQSYEREMKDGKLNMVPLYLKENPKANIEDSISYIKNKLERHKRHLLEIIMTDGYSEVPKEWKLLHLCALKGFQMLFNNFNAFDSPTALLQNINMAIDEPLVMDVQRTLLPPFVLDAHGSIKENTGESADNI